jgi:hypothetical protein
MKTFRSLGLYFIILTFVLFASSVWQIKRGIGHADFSFVILAPMALGLVYRKQWAIWLSVLLGFASSCLVVLMAFIQTFSPLTGLEVGLGPCQLSNPSAAAVWIFALIYVLTIGTPMMCALTIQRDANS